MKKLPFVHKRTQGAVFLSLFCYLKVNIFVGNLLLLSLILSSTAERRDCGLGWFGWARNMR